MRVLTLLRHRPKPRANAFQANKTNAGSPPTPGTDAWRSVGTSSTRADPIDAYLPLFLLFSIQLDLGEREMTLPSTGTDAWRSVGTSSTRADPIDAYLPFS
jgi:hypothetical protein